VNNISLCDCAMRLRSEHRVSSSKGQSRPKDRCFAIQRFLQVAAPSRGGGQVADIDIGAFLIAAGNGPEKQERPRLGGRCCHINSRSVRP
jgi:hypothetical protein